MIFFIPKYEKQPSMSTVFYLNGITPFSVPVLPPLSVLSPHSEAFEKCSIFVRIKKGENLTTGIY
jgi:hypothetical protein